MNNLKKFIVDSSKDIRFAINVIDQNSRGICFVVDNNKLVGVVTDGDIRRGLLKGFKLDHLITEIMNQDFISYSVKTNDSIIRQSFNDGVKLIPLIDDDESLVDIADIMQLHFTPIMEPSLGKNSKIYIDKCLETNWISSQGSFVREFERIFKVMHHDYNALAVSNGTVALHLALTTLGVGRGDEVIVPNLTFAATINSVLYTGATPVLCDVNDSTWCIDPASIEELITKKTKAIIPVHLYGQVCNMDQITKISNDYNLLIIEDCAEAIGSKWNDLPVGIFGDASTFSFFGNKTISTGEGGMVLFKDEQASSQATKLRDHGMSLEKKYWHDEVGFNYRMTNLQAAIGVAQMEDFDKIINKKRFISKCYFNNLKKTKEIIQFPKDYEKSFNSFWLYTVLLDPKHERDKVIEKLLSYGIETRPVFYPLNEMNIYSKYTTSNSFTNSSKLSTGGICLPSSLNLNEEKIKFISDRLIKVLHD